MESVLRNTMPSLLRCVPIAKLACLRGVCATWKQGIEHFLRFDLKEFDLGWQVDCVGFDSDDLPGEDGEQFVANLIDFINKQCRSLRIIYLQDWMPASLMHKFQHTMSHAIILYFFVIDGVWQHSEIFSQWVSTDWRSLQSLSMTFGTDDLPFCFGDWFHTIAESLHHLKHLNVEFDFNEKSIDDVGVGTLKSVGAACLRKVVQIPSLESFGFNGVLPDMVTTDEVQAPLKCLSFGVGDIGNENDCLVVEACLIRFLPRLSNLQYLKLTQLPLEVGTLHVLLENVNNITILKIQACYNISELMVRLAEIAADGTLRWLPRLRQLHFCDITKPIALESMTPLLQARPQLNIPDDDIFSDFDDNNSVVDMVESKAKVD